MLKINNSRTNGTNINLKDCKILSSNSIEATLDESGKKVVINIYEIEDEFSIRMESTISKFNIDLSGILKTVGYYFPREGSSKFNLKITDKSGKSVDIDSSNQIIITEAPKYSNLIEMTDQYIEHQKGSMNPTIRSKIIYGVAVTLKKLHKMGIYCCFLRNEDVFLDDNFEPKIGGFGIYRILFDDITKYKTIVEKPAYEIPPEFYNGNENEDILPYIDAYSFAFFVYRMFSTQVTFYKDFYKQKNINSMYRYMKLIEKDTRPIKPNNMSNDYWDLIESCWNSFPYDRPKFDEIVDILNDEKKKFEKPEEINMEELSEYKNRINSEINDEISLDQCKKEILDIFIQKVENSNQNYFIDEDDEEFHEMIEKVGEGATSYTYKIFDRKTEKFMCKKILKYQKDDKKLFKNVKNIIKEFEVLYKLIHPCICSSYGINTREKLEDPNMSKMKVKKEMTTVSIFLEFLSNKLSEVLKSGINNTLKTRIIIEIVHGMRHIHAKGMIHRDLKIDNIMLNDVFEAKIVDFGLVRIHEIFNSDFSYVNESLTKGVGTFAYMSPEMLNEEDYDYKTDVYSFGVVLYVMFTGSLPKQNLKDKTNGKKINLPSSSSSISKICINLIRKCMKPKPIDRPSFDQILSYIRQNDYKLADYVDHSIIYKRDHELELFKKYQK